MWFDGVKNTHTVMKQISKTSSCQNETLYLLNSSSPDMQHIYHVLFVCSPIDGHVGYFPFLATVKSPHLNLGVYHLLEMLLVLLDVYPVELLDCMVVLFLIS